MAQLPAIQGVPDDVAEPLPADPRATGPDPALSTARTTVVDLLPLDLPDEAEPQLRYVPQPEAAAKTAAAPTTQPTGTELPSFEPQLRRELRPRPTLEPGLAAVDAGADPGLDLPEAQRVTEPGEARPLLHDDAEPLPGSVKLRGLRAARVAVDLGDGEVVRGRVDVKDGEIDVRLKAGEGTARVAEARAGELRESLENKGLRLGRYEVEVDAEQESASDKERRDPERDERNQRQRRWQQPEDEPGSFLNRRA